MFREILVPVDGSSASLAALHLAALVANESGGRLTLLAAAEPLIPMWGAPTLTIPGATTALLEAQESLAGEALTAASAAVPAGVLHREYLVHGRAADVIVATLTKASYDLVVMGNRGRGDAGSLVLGSVSHEVLRHSPVPVLVVRANLPVRAPEEARVLEPSVAP